MARVFNVPRYYKQAAFAVGMYLGAATDDYGSNVANHIIIDKSDAATIAAEGDSIQFLHETMSIDEWIGDDISRLTDFSYQYGLGKNSERITMFGNIHAAVCKHIFKSTRRLYTDHDAMTNICYKIWTGKIGIKDGRIQRFIDAERIGAAVALNGLIASRLNPMGSAESYNNARITEMIYGEYPVIVKARVAAESFRRGVDDSNVREALDAVMNQDEEICYKKFLVKVAGIRRYLQGVKIYKVGNIFYFTHLGDTYIMDRACLEEIHQVLMTPFGFAYACIGRQFSISSTHRDGLKTFAKLFEYLINALESRFESGRSTESLARQMKSSYAVLLAECSKSADVDPNFDQVGPLKAEADSECEGEDPFYRVLLSMDSHVAVDVGTLWNCLPAPDADIAKMDRRLQRVNNQERNNDREMQNEFMNYAKSVLTAHVLCFLKEVPKKAVWEISDGDVVPEDEDWVLSCCHGNLAYPPKEQRGKIFIKKAIPWVNKAEFWHFEAQDVTHAFADLAKYNSIIEIAALRREDTNELLYAMSKGPYLSDKFTVEELRAGMETGNLPGDQVLVLSAKRENTKVGEKVRETASADDVHREAYSELDNNIQFIATTMYGVATRLGRRGFEQRMDSICIRENSGVVILSMDVSAWSPNMDRRFQMEFQDLLMSMYDIPETMRVSNWFKDVNIVHSRRGYHSQWKMNDGSVQGFFGTADSIMHNIMAQFAVVKTREAGILSKGAKVDCLTMIDDVILRVANSSGNAKEVLSSISEIYAKLGFTIDPIKSIISHDFSHFLNRIFTARGEVLTSAKILAKADREHDRRYVTAEDVISSCFNSVLGAVDRGFDPIAGYIYACHLAVYHGGTMNPTAPDTSIAYISFGAFLPVALGGWGIPDLVGWITQEGVDTLANGIEVIKRIIDTYKSSCPAIAKNITKCLKAAMGQPLVKRSATSVFMAPMSIEIADRPNPERSISQLLNAATDRIIKSDEIRKIVDTVRSTSYEELLSEMLNCIKCPVAVIETFGTALPNSVVNQIVNRIRENELAAVVIPFRVRVKYSMLLRSENRAALSFYETICDTNKDYSSVSLRVEDLRARQLSLDGANLTELKRYPALSVAAQCSGPGDIKIIVPECTAQDVYYGQIGKSKVRTINASSSIKLKIPLTHDPILKSTKDLIVTVAAAKSEGIDETIFVRAWTAIWIGQDVSTNFNMMDVPKNCSRRIARSTKNTTHSIMALPNFSGTIKVIASTAINATETVHKSFDWLSVVCGLKAMAAMDRCLGAGNKGKLADIGEVVYNFHPVGCDQFYSVKDDSFVNISDKLNTLYARQRGILAKSYVNAVSDRIKLMCNDLEINMDADALTGELSFNTIPRALVTTAYKAIKARQFTPGLLISTTSHSPLINLRPSETEHRAASVNTSDVAIHKKSAWRILRDKGDNISRSSKEGLVVRRILEFLNKTAITDKLKDNDWHAASVALHKSLLEIGDWRKIIKHWGNDHWIGLIANPSASSAIQFREQALIDIEHPNVQSFNDTKENRIRALSDYIDRYTDAGTVQAGQRVRPGQIKQQLKAVACTALRECTVRNDDFMDSWVHVGEVLKTYIVACNSTNPKAIASSTLVPSANAAQWVSRPGKFQKDMRAFAESVIDDRSASKEAYVTGITWACEEVERFIVNDLIVAPTMAGEALNRYNASGIDDVLELVAGIELDEGDIPVINFSEPGQNVPKIYEATEEQLESFADDYGYPLHEVDRDDDYYQQEYANWLEDQEAAADTNTTDVVI